MYHPDTKITSLGNEFYDIVTPANFPKTELRYSDTFSMDTVGLNLTKSEWIKHFGLFDPLSNNLKKPLALRYHGHQFHQYNPNLGDGRGFLYAQLRDNKGRLLDFGTKGSGQTPWSRGGDGKLTLLGGIREVLASRYLEHLGVNTSKTISLIETGEELQRNDEPSPTRSAVMVRLSHSHIRFGTFQRQAFLNKTDNLEKLTQYCIKNFYSGPCTPDELLHAVVLKSSELVASWMAAGFVHGVMNTDNMNITGESFDYGPYRFLPSLKSNFTAAYFDHNSLYAFSRQPEAMYWNLGQLAQSLSLICTDKKLLKVLEGFAPAYRDALRDNVFERLKIQPKQNQKDFEFISLTFKFLENSQCSWPQFWHDWQGGANELMRAKRSENSDLYSGDEFVDWYNSLKEFEANGASPKFDNPVRLLYEDIETLWKPIVQDNNWSEFIKKTESFQRQSC